MAVKISGMTAGDVADLVAATSDIEVSNLVGTAPVTRRYTFGNIATWLRQVGLGVALAVASPAAVAWGFNSGSGVDNAAGSFTMTAPLSTGAGTPASFNIRLGELAASGAGLQAAYTRLGLGPLATSFNLDLQPAGSSASFDNGRAIINMYGDASSSPSRSVSSRLINAAGQANFTAVRYNGTPALPTAVVSGNGLGGFVGNGFDGTNWNVSGSRIVFNATENWTTSAHGSQAVISVVPNTTTTLTAVLTLNNTLIADFAGPVGIGTAGIASNMLRIGGTTSGTSPKAIEVFSTLVAAQNGETLAGMKFEPTLSAGAFTGVVYTALLLQAKSVAAFTSPGDSSMISVGVLTGTGSTNAYGILIAPPTGASNNYLWAHTTVATANVTSAGAMTLASTITAGSSIQSFDGSAGVRILSTGGASYIGTYTANSLIFQTNGLNRGTINNATGGFEWDGLMSVGGTFAVTDTLISLRSTVGNHGIIYNAIVDGPEFRGFDGFIWKTGVAGATTRAQFTSAGGWAFTGAASFSAAIAAAGLPTSAGAAGSLWVDTAGGLNIVKRA